MRTIKATRQDGQIIPDGPVNWPEGCRLEVREERPVDITMTEEEQGDDPESIERWIEELRQIPPVLTTPEQEAEMMAWHQQVKEFNLEAVRRQMEEATP